jgi:mannose-1-phosphate guanylyltransferase
MQRALREHLPEMEEALCRVDRAAKEGPEAEAREVQAFFESCQSVSIDYGVMEREREASVVPADCGWSDLGSWESAWELSAKDEQGNAAPASAVLVDAKNNLVADLSTAKPDGGIKHKKVISLVGVNDLCVVETDDALLILPRERSQDVRAVVDELKKRGQGDLI